MNFAFIGIQTACAGRLNTSRWKHSESRHYIFCTCRKKNEVAIAMQSTSAEPKKNLVVVTRHGTSQWSRFHKLNCTVHIKIAEL